MEKNRVLNHSPTWCPGNRSACASVHISDWNKCQWPLPFPPNFWRKVTDLRLCILAERTVLLRTYFCCRWQVSVWGIWTSASSRSVWAYSCRRRGSETDRRALRRRWDRDALNWSPAGRRPVQATDWRGLSTSASAQCEVSSTVELWRFHFWFVFPSENRQRRQQLIVLIWFMRKNWLTPSTPAFPNCCCSNDSTPYCSNPAFLIFDIRALWRSGLSARAPECQKLKTVG